MLDHVGRTKRANYSPRDILSQKIKSLHRRGAIPVKGIGSGRFCLAVEHALGIPPNSDKNGDFMGIEIKTKTDNSLQTLFSRVPSRYIGYADKKELVQQHGCFDEKRSPQALYTSFSSKPDTLGFRFLCETKNSQYQGTAQNCWRIKANLLEAAQLSKHSETAYLNCPWANQIQTKSNAGLSKFSMAGGHQLFVS